MKTLDTIQSLAQVGKVLSKITQILCIVGACLCLVGLILAPLGEMALLQMENVTVHGLIQAVGRTLPEILSLVSAGLVMCVAEAVLASFAHRYFANELAAGTPFTLAGAKELQHLGILTIALSLGGEIAASICASLIPALMGQRTFSTADPADGFASVSLGVTFLIISLLCRYGAQTAGERE